MIEVYLVPYYMIADIWSLKKELGVKGCPVGFRGGRDYERERCFV